MFRKFVFDIISRIVTLFFVIKYFVISDFTYNLLKALAISYLMWQEQEAIEQKIVYVLQLTRTKSSCDFSPCTDWII